MSSPGQDTGITIMNSQLQYLYYVCTKTAQKQLGMDGEESQKALSLTAELLRVIVTLILTTS